MLHADPCLLHRARSLGCFGEAVEKLKEKSLTGFFRLLGVCSQWGCGAPLPSFFGFLVTKCTVFPATHSPPLVSTTCTKGLKAMDLVDLGLEPVKL